MSQTVKIPPLPITLVPNSNPPKFKWKKKISAYVGDRIQEYEGGLPANVEEAVAELIKIAEKLQFRVFGKDGLIDVVAGAHYRIKALEEENAELKQQLQKKPELRPFSRK